VKNFFKLISIIQKIDYGGIFIVKAISALYEKIAPPSSIIIPLQAAVFVLNSEP
jgi:hypothetical protein